MADPAEGAPPAAAPLPRDEYIQQCQADGPDVMRFLSRSDGAFFWVYGPDALLVAREARLHARRPLRAPPPAHSACSPLGRRPARLPVLPHAGCADGGGRGEAGHRIRARAAAPHRRRQPNPNDNYLPPPASASCCEACAETRCSCTTGPSRSAASGPTPIHTRTHANASPPLTPRCVVQVWEAVDSRNIRRTHRATPGNATVRHSKHAHTQTYTHTPRVLCLTSPRALCPAARRRWSGCCETGRTFGEAAAGRWRRRRSPQELAPSSAQWPAPRARASCWRGVPSSAQRWGR